MEQTSDSTMATRADHPCGAETPSKTRLNRLAQRYSCFSAPHRSKVNHLSSCAFSDQKSVTVSAASAGSAPEKWFRS